eukprot:TRINITY_DN2995_c0_g1_i1.p1 TRINITY_DN2995_c0_g1~~TRINITY_DN2995_c0_g1_i1.p1  ORF type:complete len:597 (-),score=41.24 TRINITY_DN2995_c0_g1_i1:347-2137(-)
MSGRSVEKQHKERMASNRSRRVSIPRSPTILEVNEDSSPDSKPNEYSKLIPPVMGKKKRTTFHQKYKACNNSDSSDEGQDDNGSTSDDFSSDVSSNITSRMSSRQLLVFFFVMVSTISSSLTVCLFPPFFPAIAESKGVYATGYGLIIGTNCLTAFLVTPFIGNNLRVIGVKFAYVSGLFGGGICCALSGGLEFFNPGPSFLTLAVLTRIVHALSNAFVITSSFTYTACEFPTAVAKVFSLTRACMNVAQLLGPWIGGLLYQEAGYYMPFLVLGLTQVLISFVAFLFMPGPYTDDDDDDDDDQCRKRKKKKVSVLKMLTIPTIWFSFSAFIVATMCNGFLSVNLEPQVIRYFELSPSYVGLLYGLRDGANSLASPIWGFLCDRKLSVKPYLVMSALLVALSFFIMKGFEVLGIQVELTLPLLVLALCLNGMGIGGQQVVGVVDALHEAVEAGYPDDPATQGLVAGLWSSLSGMGRFASRAGSGCLVDNFGFSIVSTIACGLQCSIAAITFIYLILFECHLQKRDNIRWDDVAVVDQGRRRDEKVVFIDNCSPSESIMARSVCIGIPNNSAGVRIANSMPPKKNFPSLERSRSKSVR